ncbi:MAG: transposase [Bacilli bacterium]|nr:transposase [Bacilli bacterium]
MAEFRNSHLEEFRTFGKLLNRWKINIKNSFIRVNGKRLSNGLMEGINSRIKTMMKSANGFRNFNGFRNRVTYSINKNVPIKGTLQK